MILKRVCLAVSPTISDVGGFNFTVELPAGTTQVASASIASQTATPYGMLWHISGIVANDFTTDGYAASATFSGNVWDTTTDAWFDGTSGATPEVYVEFLATDINVDQVSFNGTITNNSVH